MTRWLVVAIVLVPMIAAAQPSRRFAGLPLVEVLRLLQDRGLRVVFSSETVTASMRVVAEPKARSDRARLDEVLAPHGLRVRPAPGGALVVVRAGAQPHVPRAPRAPAPESGAEPPQTQYRERVTVQGSAGTRPEPGVASQISLRRSELSALRPVLADDPIRAAHAWPHVAGGDDFRSEFSVRGSPYRHVGIVIDGVMTRRLQHTAYGRGETGSLSMLHGDLIESASLRAGAHPQHLGATLGGQLTLTVREGSREHEAFRIAVSGSSAAAVAEGPLGEAGRGSWLVSLRQSYRDWPTRGLGEFDGTMFGFTDALAKLAYDVRPRHQVSVSLLAGRSHIDEVDGGMPYQPGDGRNHAAVLNVGLRSTFGSRSVLSQRAYLVAHEFLNKTEAGDPYGRGHEQELAYRADLARDIGGGLLETGAQVHRLRAVDDAVSMGALYAHYRWRRGTRLTIAPGVRVARSTVTPVTPVGRWLLSEFVLAPRWTVTASTGVSHQLPELDQVKATASGPALVPETATHFDVGVSQRLATDIRWHATLYKRVERDVLQPPRTAGGVWDNALSGSSRGVELLLERRRATGLSGWAAYSFGKTRYTDVGSGEIFWADFDQRHAVNVHGAYRSSDRSSVSLTFRSGTNFPIPAALDARDGGLVAGDRRNEIRLRAYARLDARASHAFQLAGRRVTLYGEVLNVLNRTNVGIANGTIMSTGEATGFTRRMMPRLASAGLVVQF